MKVKVPQNISIGAYDYKIGYASGLVSDFKFLGQAIADKQIIKIEPDTTAQTKGISLWHELIHSIADVYGCGLDEDNINRLAQGVSSIVSRDFGIEFDWINISEHQH